MWTYSRSAAGTESLLCNCSLSRKQQYYAEQTWGSFTTFTTPSELHFTSRMLEFLHSVPFHCISVCLASQVLLNSIKLPQAQTSVNKQTQTGCVLLSNLCLEHIKLRCHHILFLNVFQSLLIMGYWGKTITGTQWGGMIHTYCICIEINGVWLLLDQCWFLGELLSTHHASCLQPSYRMQTLL